MLTSSPNLNCTDNYDVAKIKMKSVTDHQQVPKMCAILQLVSAPKKTLSANSLITTTTTTVLIIIILIIIMITYWD